LVSLVLANQLLCRDDGLKTRSFFCYVRAFIKQVFITIEGAGILIVDINIDNQFVTSISHKLTLAFVNSGTYLGQY